MAELYDFKLDEVKRVIGPASGPLSFWDSG